MFGMERGILQLFNLVLRSGRNTKLMHTENGHKLKTKPKKNPQVFQRDEEVI